MLQITLMKTMIITSTMSMCWWRKNIIMLLLSLELLLISSYTIISNMNILSSPISMLIMLMMMVSGSSMGLSLLVSISHSQNSSNSNPINLTTFDKNHTY